MLLSTGEAKKRKPSVDESPAVVLKRLKPSLENAADEANERGEPCPDQLMNLEEKPPRERETKTDTERSLIEAAHHEVITKVPPVPRLAYKSWKAIEEAVADYKRLPILTIVFGRVGLFGSRKFTPQQTKKLLKRIGNNKSSQDRLKMLLDALAQVEGNEVMLMQDQFDVRVESLFKRQPKNCALSTGGRPWPWIGHTQRTIWVFT
ncbi:hypothetical protein GQ600_14761 [Phytophthora cactorum]|nr:hypothetical protein GQ600_14761 [Phytophthora cactorum]